MQAVDVLSFFRVGVSGLAVVIFGNRDDIFDCSEIFCLFTKPKEVLHWLKLDESMLTGRMIILLLNVVFFRILLYFALKRRLSI